MCKAELKIGPQLVFAVEDEDDEVMELCPICKKNYIKYNEEMCESCRESKRDEEPEVDIDKDEEWKNYLDDDEDEPEEEDEEMLSLQHLAEEEGDEIFDDEEEEEDIHEINSEPDDFDIPEIDESDFEDRDEDEEYDDEDDEFLDD